MRDDNDPSEGSGGMGAAGCVVIAAFTTLFVLATILASMMLSK